MNVIVFNSSSLVITLALLFPLFPSILPGTLGYQVLTILLIFTILFFLLAKRKLNRKSFFVSFSVLMLAIFFSIQGSLIDLYRGVFITSDVFEIPKYIAIFLVFNYFRIIRVYDDDIIRLIKCFLLISILIVAYTYFEVLVSQFKPLAYFLYKRETKEVISNKAVGPFGITYHLAYFLLIPIFGFFSYAVIYKKLKY